MSAGLFVWKTLKAKWSAGVVTTYMSDRTVLSRGGLPSSSAQGNIRSVSIAGSRGSPSPLHQATFQRQLNRQCICTGTPADAREENDDSGRWYCDGKPPFQVGQGSR